MRDEENLPDRLNDSTLHPLFLISQPSVAAILLAAGRSRRMGAFKPLLPFGEKTVIETCIDNLRNAGVETIVVVVGHRAAEVHERLAHLPLRFAVNEDAESEMGVSIARGAEQLPDEIESIFIALVDHPAVEPEVISFLLSERKRAGARLVVPAYKGRGGHPVLLDAGFREKLKHLDPERGLRLLFEAHREEVLRVPVASPYVARDMDTWEDYCALYHELFGTEPPDVQS
ncbi:MAG TPA: nucleotidyltransferase family protein [Pyrinomonadaceae bacterium]|nr:nucleotidyltransferase family protein [Pyrinomonadaceae bacterium]